MKVFEESDIGQQVVEPLLVTQVTEESGVWTNISYDHTNNEYEYCEEDELGYYTEECYYGENEAAYNALPVNKMAIVGNDSGSDSTTRRLAADHVISNPSFPTLTVSSGQPKVNF